MVKLSFFSLHHTALRLLILLLTISWHTMSYAQNGGVVIAGVIRDGGTKETVAGANVRGLQQQGKTLGSVTDDEGKFQLKVNALPVTLEISYVGFKTTEIDVYEYTQPITIFLDEGWDLENEVVIVGYGAQKRRELTSAITTVNSGLLEHNNALAVDALLGGAVAGLNVTQASGQPGAPANVRIRGGNSINASNEPLYVIDGFIFYSDLSSTQTGIGNMESTVNPLASVNPSDIESIEVLKDVSATAIYGSRGANGVIIVTTKRGKRGGNNVHYAYNTGWDQSNKKLKLLNATQWARMQKDFFFNKGQFSEEDIAQLGNGYDWQSEALQTGNKQTHELSVSGGDEDTRYLISGNYTSQTGIVRNSGFQRFTGRINLDRDVIKNRLTVGVTANAGKSTQESLTTFEDVNYNDSPYSHGIANSLTYALYVPPVVPIYNEDGSFNYKNPFEYGYLAIGEKAANPIADLEYSRAQNVNTTGMGSVYAKVEITRHVNAKVSAGVNVNHSTQNFFAPSYTAIGLATQGLGGIGNKRQEVQQSEYMSSYVNGGESYNLDALVGYTSQVTNVNYAINQSSHFTNEELGFNNLADGSQPFAPVSGASKATLQSLIARVNYSLNNRYHLTSTIRADHSSRFSKNNRWGLFPSIGLAWNVADEQLLRDYKTLKTLKLRTSTGTVGNQEIGDYEYSQIFTASRYNGSTVYNLTNLGNSKLKWETTTQYNVGIDIGILKNKITLNTDLYYKITSDLLLKVPVSPWIAPTGQLENIGNVTNKGIEISFNADLVANKKINWNLNANFAKNINTITKMGDDDALYQGKNQEEVWQVGQALGSFYGLVFDGVVQTTDNIDQLPLAGFTDVKPGDPKFKDISGANGTPDGKIDRYDRTILGSTQPKFTYGLNSTITVGNLDAFISLKGSHGNKVLNLLKHFLDRPNDAYNASAELANAWTTEKPSRTVPNIARSTPFAFIDSRHVENADFLKIQNITIGYNFKKNWGEQATFITKLRAFVALMNVLTVSPYKGYDPEIARGIDLGTYPTAKSILLGIEINF